MLKPKIKYLLLLIILLIICFCSTDKHYDEVVVCIDNIPQNLDPRVGTDVASQKIHQLLYNSLFKKDKNGNLINDLITEHQYLNEYQVKFKIKKGIKFHNGKILQAEDIKFTFESLLKPGFRSFRKSSFKSLKQIRIINNYEIMFELKEKDASLFNNLTIGIIPCNSSLNFKSSIVGSGPYRFIEARDNLIRLKKFRENNENRNNFEYLTIKVILDPVTRALELQSGGVDIVINDIPIDNLNVLKENKDLSIESNPGSKYNYIAFNFKDKFLARKSIREAICHGINRDKIIKYMFSGYARKAESVLPVQNIYYKKFKHRDYNPEYSMKLMSSCGFTKSKKLVLELKCSSSGMGRKLALVLREQLSRINVNLKITVREFSSFYSDIKSGNFQLYILAWVGVSDPDIFYYLFSSSCFPPAGANRGFYLNQRIDYLTRLGRETYDISKRKIIYAEIQDIIYQDIPYVSLWYNDNIAVMSRKVKNFMMYSIGEFYFLKDIRIIKPRREGGEVGITD